MVVAGMDALSDPAKHFDTSGKSGGTIPSSRNLKNAHGPARQGALQRDCRQKILSGLAGRLVERDSPPPRQPHPHSANGRHGKQSLKEIAPLRLIKLSRL